MGAYFVPGIYPLEIIEAFFAMLRLSTGFETGYAQLLVEPIGWAPWYTAKLPCLTGTAVRRYPPQFEDYYWTRDILPLLTTEHLLRIQKNYESYASMKGCNQESASGCSEASQCLFSP